MKEGTREREVEKIIYCRGFKKPLRFKDCTPENCRYHFGVVEAPIYQTANGVRALVRIDLYVRCGVPKLEPVTTLCEVDE